MKVMDQTLQSLWKNHTGPWDVRVSVEFYKWVNTDHPEQGFTQVGGAVDITKYLEGNKLQGLREEVEAFKSGKYGMIKASGLAQEFIERLEGIAKTQMGALLPDLLLENDRNASYRYKYDGESVHLWQLVVKIGDAKRDKWISYDWIYGWLYDPTDPENTTPRWEGTGRVSLGRLRISAFTLLHWLAKTGSEFLGDYQNPAFKYRDVDNEAGVMDFEEEENTLIGNYPLVPIVVEALHHVGVKDEYIHGATKVPYGFPDIPPKGAGTYAYSTIDYKNTAYLGGYIPESFFWKADGDKSLEIWYPGYPATIPDDSGLYPCFYLTECDSKTSLTRRKPVNLHDININVPNKCVTRRMWMDKDTGILYVLAENRSHYYFVLKITLAGDYDSIASSSSLVMSRWVPSAAQAAHRFSHVQMDIDYGQNRLYGSISNESTHIMDIGYWTLTWHNDAPGSNYSVYQQVIDAANMTNYHASYGYMGGFRAVRDPASSNHGIVCFAFDRRDTNYGFYIIRVDESDTAGTASSHLYEGVAGTMLRDSYQRFQFFGEHGSIGGFYKDDFYNFPLASWRGHYRYWLTWRLSDPAIALLRQAPIREGQAQGRAYRTFASHGSNNQDYTTGWTYAYNERGIEEPDEEGRVGDNDYKISMWPAKFCINVSDADLDVVYSKGSAFANKWEYPLISAPSVVQDTVLGTADNSIHDRSFVYSKYYVDIEETDRYRAFLVIHSKTWLPNFSKDFISDGGSLKDEFADICVAFGLIGRFSLWGTYIFPRKPEGGITAEDSVMTITPDWNGYKEQNIPGVNRVKVEYPGGVTIYPTTNESRNMLNVQSDYILEDRASKFAVDLYALHKDNHTQYVIESSYLAMLEPGVDIVQLCLPIPPGGVGFTNGETELYEKTAGVMGKHVQELVLGRMMRVDIKGLRTTITVVNL